MRVTRVSPLLFTAMATLIVSACGSSADQVASRPAPLRLSLPSAASADSAKPALYPERDTTYVLDGTLADLGPQAPVRKLVAHPVTEAEVAHIATVLGMQGAPARTDSGYEVRDGDALLSVDTSFGSTYVNYSSSGNAGGGSSPGSRGSGSASDPQPVDPQPPAPDPDVTIEKPPATPPVPLPTVPPAVDVPNADDAARIAKSLLDDLGVLDDQQWSHNTSDFDGATISCAVDEPCDAPPDSAITARTVGYELLIDGNPVPGVGWSVTIGSHRRIEAVSGTWARPEPGDNYDLRSTQGVFDDLRNGRAQYVGVQAMLATGAAEIAPQVAPDTALDTAPGIAPDIAEDPPRTTPDATVGPVPPLVIHITGVSLGAARWDGSDKSGPVAYLVPTYRFHATIDGGSPYDIELLALDPASFTMVSPPPVTEVPSTGTPGGEDGGREDVPQPPTDLPAPAPVPDVKR